MPEVGVSQKERIPVKAFAFCSEPLQEVSHTMFPLISFDLPMRDYDER